MKRAISVIMSLVFLLCILPAFAQAEAASTQDNTATGEQLVGVDVPFTITETQTVIENERYILKIEPGIYVPASIEDDINLIMDTAEEILGLSFYPEKPAYTGLGKVEIEVINPDLHDGIAYAYGGLSGVTVSSFDILIWAGNGWTVLHELTHCLHFRNGYMLPTTVNEGIATNVVLEASGKAAFPITVDSYFNYIIHETQNRPNEENALDLFLELDNTSDNWNCYLYGFPMVMFMKEEYGKDAQNNLILHADKEILTNKELVPIIQSLTSEDFFPDSVAGMSRIWRVILPVS